MLDKAPEVKTVEVASDKRDSVQSPKRLTFHNKAKNNRLISLSANARSIIPNPSPLTRLSPQSGRVESAPKICVRSTQINLNPVLFDVLSII